MFKNIISSQHSLCFRLLPNYIFAECVCHSFSAFDGDRYILNKLVLWGIATILAALNLGQPHLRIWLDLSIWPSFWRSIWALRVDAAWQSRGCFFRDMVIAGTAIADPEDSRASASLWHG